MPEHTSILVVDDNETTRYVLGRWLRRSGYEVTEASTGAEALACLAAGMPDLAVLDVNLPDMIGFELLEHIKRVDPAVPVLHLSATSIEVGDRAEGLDRGADAYLIEPVEQQEVLSTIAALLRYSTARRAAEKLSAQLLTLHDGSVDLHAATTVELIAEVAARTGARLLGRTVALAAYGDEQGTICLAQPDGPTASHPYRPESLARAGALTIRATAGVVSSTVIASFEPPEDLTTLLSPLQGRTVEGMLTRHHKGNAVVGVLVDGVVDDPDERVLLAQVVRSAVVAVENVRLFQVERSMALTLQRALLPDRDVVIAGLDIATWYSPSDNHAEVGGDFFDIFTMEDERVALVIGDVQGHSIEAAAVMGDLRAAIRGYATEGLDPGQVLERTNRQFLRFHPTQTATVIVAFLDPATHRLEVANAGHLPPLVRSGDSSWWLTGVTPLLGAFDGSHQSTTVQLPEGSTIVMVTDGLIERRTRDLDESLDALADAVRHESGTAARICRLLIERCADVDGQTDDVAVIALRFDEASSAGHPRIVDGNGPLAVVDASR